ncbi:LmeA family phospholipid-binding protein [Nocardia sp. NPDC052566]|uniref:LmeA family phospholipid-binding protein n=1 Tax=Nocardia sp. NPDC052566 TaxID=3364330 RepID=UPI0037CB6B10
MRKLIIGLLCLAGLAVVIDFGTAAYAEYRVSRALRAGADLSADPSITIGGNPFLLKGLEGRYDSIKFNARGKRPGIPGEVTLDAYLTGVHVDLNQLIDGSLRNIPVDRIEGGLRIEPVELGRLFGIPDLEVRGRTADKSDGTGGSGGTGMTTTPDALLLIGTLPGPPGLTGARYGGAKVAVTADIWLDADRQVRILATSLYRGTGLDFTPTVDIPEADQPAVLAQFTRTIEIKELPFGIQPSTVIPLGGQIVVGGTAQNVTIDLDRLQQP